MKTIILALLPLALLAADGQKKDTKPAKPAAAKSSAITIPPDAEKIGPQVYRYKDKDGKIWIYRQTPFGISKLEQLPGSETAAAAPPPASTPSEPVKEIPTKVTEQGDSVRFEQATPMGPRVWTKKKSELSPQEKAWVDMKLGRIPSPGSKTGASSKGSEK